MNYKVKTIILRAFAIFCSLFAMVSMAFGAIFSQTKAGDLSYTSESSSFGDWFSQLNGDASFVFGDAEGTWKASEAFFIISIILLSLIIIGIVLQFFIKKGWLNLTIKIISIVSMLTVLAAFVLMLTGCIQWSSLIGSAVNVLPAAGGWLFVIFGLIGSGLGIACGQKLTAKKRKK